MAAHAGCVKGILGWVTDSCSCLQIVKCPVCHSAHVIEAETMDFDHLAFPNLPIAKAEAQGKGDIEHTLELVCPPCHRKAARICGEDVLVKLCREGEIELYEQTVREVCAMLAGARLRRNCTH